MNRRLYETIFGDTGRTVFYLLVGTALCASVVVGFAKAWQVAKSPIAAPVVKTVTPPPKPDRYVPPAAVEYPFF